jgi:ribonucleoside-diphosphate reductase alpha chain/ribonucleoside-triphosphate reductase
LTIKILKRNDTEVEYDGSKIVLAITKAMYDVDKKVNKDLAHEIEIEIYDILINGVKEASISEVSDAVEELLMKHGEYKVAKEYILYRSEQDKNRKKEKYGILSKEFLSKYKHLDPPMKQLGEFVYFRTYSRFLPDKKRRENWWETVRRAVEYNSSLVNTSAMEAEALFDNIFYLRQFLSGRTFWIGNTDVSLHYPMANYNCSFQIINDLEAFRDVFYLLMIGSGAGVRIRKSDIESVPPFRTDFEVIHKDYANLPKNEREDNTALEFFYNHTAKITIGDSKEGWVQALDFYIHLMSSSEYRNIKTIIIDYDHVRPQGEKLKTFGGTASGHIALLNMFKGIDKVIKRGDGKHKLKPIDGLDICNMIGEGVVVGGVRRTSEVVLMDSDDEECIEAKSELYKQINGKWVIDKDIIHRQLSNNSIYYTEKPTRDRLHWQIERMRYSGEPAWVNAEAASKRRPNFNGVNPLT